ncbi:MAG: hypothetical protein OEN20_00675 [Gammaproteobacteria bacterium]|nr:hypothetical protein [Gammaproteobacteria bacterium]
MQQQAAFVTGARDFRWRSDSAGLSNRALRLLAWNLPYRTAHHCQPAVPLHALPRLHPARLVRSQGYLQFHCELIARLRRGDAPAV